MLTWSTTPCKLALLISNCLVLLPVLTNPSPPNSTSVAYPSPNPLHWLLLPHQVPLAVPPQSHRLATRGSRCPPCGFCCSPDHSHLQFFALTASQPVSLWNHTCAMHSSRSGLRTTHGQMKVAQAELQSGKNWADWCLRDRIRSRTFRKC